MKEIIYFETDTNKKNKIQEERLNFLAQFNSDFKIKDWCFEKTIYIEDCKDYKFYNREVYHEKYEVPIEKVIGTGHFSYVNRRWIDLIGNMKKSKSKWNKENFLEFSKTSKFLNGYSYAKFGDSYFVTGGNHRNCEAKFSELESIKAPVTEYIFDVEMLKTWRFLEKEKLLPIIDEGNSRKYYRNLNWTITINKEKILFNDFETIKKFVTHYRNMKITLKELCYFYFEKKGFISKKNKMYFNAFNNDYNQLNSLILEHKKSLN